ncbi:MAG: glycoside hydrolase family 2 protein [Bacteroidota bacterium]
MKQSSTYTLNNNKQYLHEGWSFRQLGQENWLPATVPGCNHLDLMQNGIILDPFWGSQEDQCQWVEYQDWEYRLAFEVDQEDLEKDWLELVFEGLDTYVDIFLDEELVLQTDNMYRRWTIPLKGKLKQGIHHLRLYFHSPTNKVLPELAQLNFRYHAVQDNAIEASPLSRKAPYHYGWDWGPRLVTSGIWKEVYLKSGNICRIEQLDWIQQKVTKETAFLEAHLQLEVARAGTIDLEVFDEQGLLPRKSFSFELEEGFSLVKLPYEIESPQLWWPNGLGAPHLYHLGLKMLHDSQIVDEFVTEIGIRDVVLVQEADEWGETFTFHVNGQPVFVKGANWIPDDSFLTKTTEERLRKLLQAAVDANFNMLRVWGGGIYETDLFYQLCNELGIMVWQDFMFSCSLYPATNSFLDNVKEEAIQQVIRLKNHPSLVLWCGNNENEWIYDLEGQGMWKRFGIRGESIKEFQADYEKLYHQLLPDVVAEFDPSRSYWPSSPSSLGKAPANDNNYGDIHHWDVWHMGHPVEEYLSLAPRFISEFGFQGMPDLRTLTSYLPENQRFIGSPAMHTHQKHARGYDLIRTYLERNYPAHKDFESFVYLSQVQQAENIKFAVEHFRSLQPKCMGILYWQFNDCWPVCSWSSVDYHGYWKALHYFAKKFYASQLVMAKEVEGLIEIYVLTDHDLKGLVQLNWELRDFYGQVYQKTSMEGKDLLMGAHRVLAIPLETLVTSDSSREKYLHFRLERGGNCISENRYFFASPKELRLNDPKITFEVKVSDSSYQVILKAESLARNVFLQSDVDGWFEDNYFDLDASHTKTVCFHPSLEGGHPTFSITSLWEQSVRS